MKKIILKSKLSEDEVLSKLGEVSKDLLAKGLISKGDEIVEGVDEKDGSTFVTINADLMTKDNYKNLKAKFLEVGEVLKNDLKNFDEESPKNPEAEGETKDPKNKDPEEEQKALDQNKIKPAEAVLHDTNELLFDINPNQKVMDDLKNLLFSEEEINKAPESEEKRPADPAAEEKKPESKEHDDEKGKESNDEKDPKDPDAETKEHDDSENPEKEVELHDLLFSDEELNEGLELHDLLFSDEELEKPADSEKKKEESKNPEEKEHDADSDPEKKECPFRDKKEALKELAECRRKEAEGKKLSTAEKFFCDAASKHFSDEEVKEATEKKEVKEHDEVKKFKVLCPEGKLIKDGFDSEEAAKKFIEEKKIEGATVVEDKAHDADPEPKKPEEKKEDPKKPEDKKEDPKPEEKKEETKMELIRRLNKENNSNSLLERAKEINKINK